MEAQILEEAKKAVSKSIKVYMKAEGLKAGIPDLMLPFSASGYHGLFIELKTKTGKTQPNQKEWCEKLAKEGYRTEICFGWDSAREVIEKYILSE